MTTPQLEAQVLDAIRSHKGTHPQGVSQALLQSSLPDVPVDTIAAVLNGLSTSGRVEYAILGREAVFKEKKEEDQAKFRGLGSEELLIYQLIENAQNNGISKRDIRMRSNLGLKVEKMLTVLSTRGLIKKVENRNQKNNPVWLLTSLEASTDITGGAWYTDSRLDVEFIKQLREIALGFMRREGLITVQEVHKFMRDSGLVQMELSVRDIQEIFDTLLYDGRIEVVADALVQMRLPAAPRSQVYYKPSSQPPLKRYYTQTPCAACPVFEHCRPGGIISPESCEYMDEWLKF